MFIIWRGLGWLVPVVFFGVFLLSDISLSAVYGDGFFERNEWPKIMAVVVSSLLIALLGYILNYRNRKMVIDPVSGENKKPPSHSLFFIPVEAWAIIIPASFFLLQNHAVETSGREMILIGNPVVDDVYLVDFTEVFVDFNQRFKYGSMRVVSVKSDGVEVVISDIVYDKKSGIKKDVRNGVVYKAEYYSGEYFFISNEDVVDLKNRKGIFQVSRNQM